ncbi:MAG: alkaline phosphatase family protein [Nanoarchaeota archaeon]
MESKKNKLLIMGIDGASFDIIIPLIKKGKLPTYRKLMQEGIWGILKSTVPPVTCPAWPSFSTGLEARNHGIFDWFWYDENYKLQLNWGTDVKGKRYWDYLDDAGLICGVMNVPYVYPLRIKDGFKGFLIAGFLAAGNEAEKEFTYPAELKYELLSEGYEIESPLADLEPASDEKFLTVLMDGEEKRKEVAIKLIKEKEWDVFSLIFRHPEGIQHRFWKEGSMYIIEDVYEQMDKILGEIIGAAEKKVGKLNVIVMSDHGFGRTPLYNFYLSRWLQEKGYLKVKSSVKVPLYSIYNFLIKIGFGKLRYFVKKNIKINRNIEASVIWKDTKAWARMSEDIGLIYLNKKGKFAEGNVENDYDEVREKLIKDLAEIEHNNKKVVEKIWRKEELFGDSERAPDIIIRIRPEYRGICVMSNKIFEDIPASQKLSWHSEKSVFVSAGPDIRRGRIEGARLIDLAPTILAFYNIKADEMDGKVLDIFKK